MPKNNKLETIELPMKLRFNEEPITEFKNNLESIKITAIGAPSMDQLRDFMVPFLEATWAENPSESDGLPTKEKDKIIQDCLNGKSLPTALETINIVFKIEGISIQEVTHILRYRNASFSADCSGDKWWSHKDALVPNSVENSKEFYKRYKNLVKESKKLYADMIDSKQVSIMDARYILPRCLETFYFMRISLKDAIHLIKQRIDRQIQPETDNVIAYQMYIELLKLYPVMNNLIDIHSPSWFYQKLARTGKATNLYYPDKESDTFEWNENDFIYQKHRCELNGTNEGAKNLFNEILKDTHNDIEEIQRNNRKILEKRYLNETK